MESFCDGVLWGCGFTAIVLFIGLIIFMVMENFPVKRVRDWWRNRNRKGVIGRTVR